MEVFEPCSLLKVSHLVPFLRKIMLLRRIELFQTVDHLRSSYTAFLSYGGGC